MQPDLNEALRYLGVRGKPDGALFSHLTTLAGELEAQITPRFIWRTLPLERTADALLLDSQPLPGRTAAKMLADCTQCALLVCTLGVPFDAWLRRLQARDMAQAVMLDALGSAYVESACDEAEREIAARFPSLHLTDRFSPGYGDLPLTTQQPLLEELDAPRSVGVQLLPSLLMSPQKSVTAIIGLAEKPQMARIRGCAYCALNQSCEYRKAGTTCHV